MEAMRAPPTRAGLEAMRSERRDRRWARNHFRAGQPVDPSWSAAIKDECRKIEDEFKSPLCGIDED